MDATRQYATDLSGIRDDHRKRYEFAPVSGRVLDAACGCGYGSLILQERGCKVVGIDIDREAIEWARRYFAGPRFYQMDVCLPFPIQMDAVVCFETLEHLEHPERALKSFHAPKLVASVPNEKTMPFNADTFRHDAYPHLRHYTPTEFEELLNKSGWEVTEKYTQTDKRGELSAVRPGTDGRFLIYVGKHCTLS